MSKKSGSGTWKKESAAAGLGGLSVAEAAVGAMTLPDFQKLPDPVLGVSFSFASCIIAQKTDLESVTVLP